MQNSFMMLNFQFQVKVMSCVGQPSCKLIF